MDHPLLWRVPYRHLADYVETESTMSEHVERYVPNSADNQAVDAAFDAVVAASVAAARAQAAAEGRDSKAQRSEGLTIGRIKRHEVEQMRRLSMSEHQRAALLSQPLHSTNLLLRRSLKVADLCGVYDVYAYLADAVLFRQQEACRAR
jgi:hypothetical protein